nr:hypothetical protein K-LCC10_0084 [Kaumoebavirus]
MSLPIDIPLFNNLKKFATYLMYSGLRDEIKNRVPNNAFINYCETIAHKGISATGLFRDYIYEPLFNKDLSRHYVDIICETIGDTQTALDFTTSQTVRYACEKCGNMTTSKCSAWSLLFSEADFTSYERNLQDIINSYWFRRINQQCNVCDGSLLIYWMGIKMSKYAVIDYSRSKNKVEIPKFIKTPYGDYILDAYGIGNRINVRIECESEVKYQECEDGEVRDSDKMVTDSELRSENLNLLIYKKI